jgi:hypothetical protein
MIAFSKICLVSCLTVHDPIILDKDYSNLYYQEKSWMENIQTPDTTNILSDGNIMDSIILEKILSFPESVSPK